MEVKTKTSRMTRQRKLIFDELCKVTTHPSAVELYETVRAKLPNISLGTVYRNLELLSENGQILKLELSSEQRRYDGNIKEHQHVRCVDCDRVADLHGMGDLDLMQSISDSGTFEITGYRLEFLGVCQECKNNQ